MLKKINWVLNLTGLEQFFINNQNDFFVKSKICIAWYFAFVVIISIFYLIFSSTTIILYTIYSLIGLLIILLHVLVIKNLNLKFDEPTNIINAYPKYSFFIFLFKMFFLQAGVCLLANWLFSNLLVQGELNNRFVDISSNLIPEGSFVVLINGFVNWIVFISLLLGIGFYKYYFKSANVRFAKCLLPTVNNQPWIFIYNILLSIESYIRVVGFITLLTVLSVALFEIIANKYRLFSFLKYPMIISFLILIVFSFFKKNLEKSIDFLCKKKSMDFINIFMILFLVCSAIIFIVNQVLLAQIEFLKIIPTELSTKSVVISRFFQDASINQDRIKVLFVGLNVMLTFGAATDLFLKQINGYKIWIVYFSSCIFPVAYTIFFYKFDFNIFFNNLLTTDLTNLLMVLATILIYKMNYKNIYHSFCFFGLKSSKDGGIDKRTTQSTRVGFSLVIKRTITMYFLYLGAYYVFAWILAEHVLAFGVLCTLAIMSMLVIKIILQLRN